MDRTRIIGWSALGATFLPNSAHAQITGLLQNTLECNFTTGQLWSSCIPSFIAHLVGFIFGLLGLFFLANVIFAGYQMAMSGLTGDKEAGKRRLIWAIAGLIISLCAFVIIDLILSVITERI